MVKGGESILIELIRAGMKSEEYICNNYPGAKETLDKIKEEIESIPFINRNSYRRIDLYMRELKDKLGGDMFPSDILPLVSYAFPQGDLETVEEEGEEEEDTLSLTIEADKLFTLYLVLRYHPFRSLILRRLVSRGINATFFLKVTPGEMVKLMEILALADHEAVESIKRYLSGDDFLIEFGVEYDEPRVKSILSYPYLTEFELDRDMESIIAKLKRRIFLNEEREWIARDILLRLSAFNEEGKTIALLGPRGIGKSTLITSLLKASEWPFFSLPLSPSSIDRLFGNSKDPGLIFKGVVSCGVINPCMIFEDIETSGRKVESFLLQIVDPYNRQEMRDNFTGTRLLLGKSTVFLIGSKLTRRFKHPAISSNMEIYTVSPLKLEEAITVLSGYIIPKVLLRVKPKYRKEFEALKDKEISAFLLDLLKERQAVKGGFTLEGLERAVEKLLLLFLSRKEKEVTISSVRRLGPILKRELGGEAM